MKLLRDNPGTNETEIVERIRGDILESLGECPFETELFLIDNHMQEKYDFEKLKARIFDDLPARQKEVLLVYTLSARDKATIKAKADMLRKRAWRVPFVSGVIAAVFIPGVSLVADTTLLVSEAIFYYKQFGLDEKSLRESAKLMSVDVKLLQDHTKKKFPTQIDIIFVKLLLSGAPFLALMAGEEVSRVLLPVIGSVIAAPISYATMLYALRSMIDKMEETALELTQFYQMPTAQ